MTRPSWDQYFLDLVEAVAKRATCNRGKSGCVVVRDHRILSTGYVGSPAGQPHCDDVGHDLRYHMNERGSSSDHCVRTTHCEQNAIAQAARFGQSLLDSTFYISMEPCKTCASMIIGVGAQRVVVLNQYHAGKEGRVLLEDAGVDVVVLGGMREYDTA
jgi:dCMP deaminase